MEREGEAAQFNDLELSANTFIGLFVVFLLFLAFTFFLKFQEEANSDLSKNLIIASKTRSKEWKKADNKMNKLKISLF